MVEARRDHHHGGNAMDDTARIKDMVAESAYPLDPPGFRKTQHESREDEDNKTDQQTRMLDPLVHGHAEVKTVTEFFVTEQAASDPEFSLRLLDEVEQVVDEHPADHDHDHDDVGSRDPVEQGLPGLHRHVDVNRAHAEPYVRSGMTLAARRGEVRLIRQRRRIVRGLDVVRAMTARAVGYLQRASPNRQAMITV